MRKTQPEEAGENVLVVDDDLRLRQTLEALLTGEGYDVRCAASGGMALMFAAEEPPDLILLDIRLPDIDGFEVCRRLSEALPAERAPVIFISGLYELGDKVKGFAAGGVDYVSKPFQTEEVLARVKVHLSLRRLQKQMDAKNAQLEQEVIKRTRVEERLQKAHDELEERVQARTAELASANEQLVASGKALQERLEFERVLSKISSGFVNIPPHLVDFEIESGLRQILEVFRVDRCGLVRTLPGKSAYQVTHLAYREDLPPVPVGAELPISMYPWSYEKLITKREVVAVSRFDDLPPEANIDKQTYQEWGIRSCLNIPISTTEPIDRIFIINTVKSERVWPEEFIPRLRLLGEVFVNALERKEIRRQSEERLQLEVLMSDLLANFASLPSDEVESEINKGLRSVAGFFDAERCSIGLFSEDGTQLVSTFEYCSEGVEPAPGAIWQEQMPWYMGQLVRGNPVVIHRVEDLPPEAEKERQLCLIKGMKSILSIPLVRGGKTLGFCALVSTCEERVWPEELLQRFRLVAEVFVNALERKRAEAEIARARAELLHFERSMRLSELTASLAHELNQPLAAILSNAQAALRFLKSNSPDLNEFQEIIRDIISDDQRAGDVIRSLRAMMKREEGEKRSTHLNAVLNDVIQIFRSEAIFRNVSVETELAGTQPPVFGDKVQLQQVLLNVIMNAAEAMSQNPSEKRRIIVRTKVIGRDIRVSVRDFGPGIHQADLNRVFHPFFTTKNTGLGMGLALSSSIIKGHGGRIWAENNPNGGATFFIELPVEESGKGQVASGK